MITDRTTSLFSKFRAVPLRKLACSTSACVATGEERSGFPRATVESNPENRTQRKETYFICCLLYTSGLRQAARALALLPFAAFLQKLDTFKTLQDGTLAAYGTGCFEAGMLGHDLSLIHI